MGVIRTNLRPSEGIMVFKNPLTPFGDRKTKICSNFFTLLRPLRRVFHIHEDIRIPFNSIVDGEKKSG